VTRPRKNGNFKNFIWVATLVASSNRATDSRNRNSLSKKKKAVAEKQPVINESYELVATDRLQPHPRNVNRGDLVAIGGSIAENGFYGAVVAQKSTGHILAGNHRYDAAKAAGIAEVPVTWVDVDDDRALRILLADNRTTRLGHDDQEALAALLAGDPGGY
jgi:ParB-like chromosome segregation protein Spo0J